MIQTNFTATVTTIDKDYYASKANNAFQLKTKEQRNLFDILTEPKNIYDAITVVTHKGGSPISVYSTILETEVEKGTLAPLCDIDKKIAGVIIRVVFEANGWMKTGTKQKITKGVFKSGEIYYVG